MFGFRSPQVAQRSPGSSKLTKGFTTRIRNGSSTFTDTVSNIIKRTSRRLSLNKSEIPTELCPRCIEYILDRSQDSVHDIRFVTSLSLTFNEPCPQQELHVVEMLGMMGGLRNLELLDVRITPSFYAILAERAQFQLEYFACESPLFDSLLRFLSTQRHLLEFTYHAQSLETQTTTRVCGQEVLCTIRTLSTTAPLLLHPKLDATSLRHLEYMGGGQSLREEIRAIEEIYRLGPQLRSLRFMWGAGRTETFSDVTRFLCIATNTSSVKHIYLSDISRNVRGFPRACLIFITHGSGSVLDIRAIYCYGSQVQDLEEAADSCMDPKSTTRERLRRVRITHITCVALSSRFHRIIGCDYGRPPSTEKAIHHFLLVLNKLRDLLLFCQLVPRHIHFITQDTLVVNLGYKPRRSELPNPLHWEGFDGHLPKPASVGSMELGQDGI